MRTTSMVLGIIGGVIAILFGSFIMLGGIAFSTDNLWDAPYADDDYNDVAYRSGPADSGRDVAAAMFIGLGVCALASGVLGLTGGIIAKKKNTAAGVMMIIAAVLSAIGFFNLISVVLFILGAVFALKKEPQPAPYPYYGYPPNPQYYPYPPQQYPQVYPYPQYYYPQQPLYPPPPAPPPQMPPDGIEPPQRQ